MAGFVAEPSGRRPLPFLWPRNYITVLYFHVLPSFCLKQSGWVLNVHWFYLEELMAEVKCPGGPSGVKAERIFRFCSSFKRCSCPLAMWVQFLGSLFLGAKGPRLLSPEIIFRVLCKSWWLWLYSVAMCEWEEVEAAGIHSRNTWALDFARATPGNVSALPLQGCKNRGCVFLTAS